MTSDSERIPSSKTMEEPALEFLKDGLDHRTKEINDYIATKFDLTEEDRRIPQSNGNTFLFANRAGWCTTYLKNKGEIERSGYGIWKITEKGLNRIKGIKTNQLSNQQAEIDEEEEYPTDIMKQAATDHRNKIKDRLLDNVFLKDGFWFEKFVKELLLKMGYGLFATVTKRTGDKGIDVIISEDPLGVGKIYAQAKRYEETTVPIGAIREFCHVVNHNQGRAGIFVTTSKFPKSAVDEISGSKSIILIDGDKLTDLMIEYKIGIEEIENYPVYSIDEKYFKQEDI